MIKYRNITYPVVSATESKAAQLIAFALGYKWYSAMNQVTKVKTVATLKWLGFDPDDLLIRVYDRDYATHKSFDQAVNLNQLTEKLSNPTPTPKVPELPSGRPYAIVTFLYPKSETRKLCRRIVRVQSMDEDYLTGYEIKDKQYLRRSCYAVFLRMIFLLASAVGSFALIFSRLRFPRRF